MPTGNVIVTIELTPNERVLLATGLILVKDYLTEGRFDVETIKPIIMLAMKLGLKEEYGNAMAQMPPMRMEPR